jgi:hypothetical protein
MPPASPPGWFPAELFSQLNLLVCVGISREIRKDLASAQQRSSWCSVSHRCCIFAVATLLQRCFNAVVALLQRCCNAIAPQLHCCCNCYATQYPSPGHTSSHGTQKAAFTPIILCAKNSDFSPYLQKKSLAAPKIYVEMRIGWDWGGGEGIVGSNHPGSPRQGAKGRAQVARPYGHPPTSSLPRRHSTPRSPGWVPAELSWLNLLLHK